MKIIKLLVLVFICILTLVIVRCNIAVNSTVKAIEKYSKAITFVSDTVMNSKDEDEILKSIKQFRKSSEKYTPKIKEFLDLAETDGGIISDRVAKKAGGDIEKILRAEYDTIPKVEKRIKELAETSPKIRNYMDSY